MFFKIYIVWPTLIDNEEIKNGGMLAVIKSNNLAINYLNVKLGWNLFSNLIKVINNIRKIIKRI